MLHVLINTIFPIFSIILLGYFLSLKQIINADFARPANQIVFNVAIPAMLLNEISQAPFRENFNSTAVLCCLAALGGLTLVAVVLAKILKISEASRGTFVQSSLHGNIGYMSYAIAYYTLGEAHFAKMAILGSFVMLAQNLLGVWALTAFTPGASTSGRMRGTLKHIFRNPIIVTVALGIVYSALGFSIPGPIQRGLNILSGMAFPTALLLIGASLSFGAVRVMVREVVGIGLLKLLGLPFLGYVLMKLAGVPDALILVGMILLASPPATVTYVMATEMGGNPELAATSVSIHTLLSAFSYSLIISSFANVHLSG